MDISITTTVEEAGGESVEVAKVIHVPATLPVLLGSSSTTIVQLSDGSQPVTVTKIAGYFEKR
jgi:hypothetical protein